MDNTRNALAELAKRLDKGRWNLDVKDYDKAVLIVGELAKVRNHECSTEPMFFDCKNAIRNCRAIAEEGGDNAVR